LLPIYISFSFQTNTPNILITMPIRQQRLHSIHFIQLKSLRNVTISFEDKNVTGIFGANGSGKSSIIHALLALYKPGDQAPARRNFKFSEFFLPTTHTRWTGSEFTIVYTQRDNQQLSQNLVRRYAKGPGRWSPRYLQRPERDVYFIGVSSATPDIELEKKDTLMQLNGRQQNGANAARILQAASQIMNRDYEQYEAYSSNRTPKTYIGVRHRGINYSSLSMGAGEQRLFKILETVFNAPDYSLIVIDEIDLTLHTNALKQLLNLLVDRAAQKNLQIVFTSHREELTQRIDINVRHIYQTAAQTICFNETNPDCLERLTGDRPRPIEIFVEDELGEAVARKITEQLRITRHCTIKHFGAAVNSFVLAAGLRLNNVPLDNTSVVLDGDVYLTQQDKEGQMRRVLTGNEPYADQRRAEALSCIRQFNLPAGMSPEQFINQALQNYNDGSEVCNAALAIHAVGDRHGYVDNIVATLGYENTLTGLTKVVDKLFETPEWTAYTEPIRNWLIGRIAALHL
jgi:ABC-type lipoprotein export system ATPase subunit